MAEIAEAVDARQQAVAGGLDDADGPGRTLDDDAEIAGAARLRRRHAKGQTAREGKSREDLPQSHGARPCFSCSASQSASASFNSKPQGGIGVPGTPSRMIVASD